MSLQEIRNEFKGIAEKLLDNDIDIIIAFRKLDQYWTKAGLPESGELYNYVCHITSESDNFVKGESRKLYAKEYLELIDQEESEFIEDTKLEIIKFAEDLKFIITY